MSEIICGDSLTELAKLDAGIVQTCVTSPPYYGLRDYGTATWEGGSADCEHKQDITPRTERPRNGLTGGLEYMKSKDPVYRDTCGKCGAVRVDTQIGLEATPDEYIAKLVAVFREVRRVLKDDGTLWVNIGDSYAGGNGNGGVGPKSNKQTTNCGSYHGTKIGMGDAKPKDLLGIPWMLAFALRADGWYLRSDIIWSKPNPMPESITDRCTKSHEYIFMLSKSAKYYYDAEAIKEVSVDSHMDNIKVRVDDALINSCDNGYDGHRTRMGLRTPGKQTHPSTRNKRDVWTVSTKPYSGAHFATFPRDLILPCIMAGSKPGDIVLDPFGGAGTTAKTAQELGREYITIELSQKYVDTIIAQRLLATNVPLAGLL
jgi:DNA modification methylase